MEIVFDEVKRRSNVEKHGLDFADLSDDFIMTCHVEPAKQNRLLAIGRLREQLIVAVVFAPLGVEAISIVSMRRANKKEISRWLTSGLSL